MVLEPLLTVIAAALWYGLNSCRCKDYWRYVNHGGPAVVSLADAQAVTLNR